MISGGNNYNYFLENQLTKLAHFLHFKRVLRSCLSDWWGGGGSWVSCAPPLLATPLPTRLECAGEC